MAHIKCSRTTECLNSYFNIQLVQANFRAPQTSRIFLTAVLHTFRLQALCVQLLTLHYDRRAWRALCICLLIFFGTHNHIIQRPSLTIAQYLAPAYDLGRRLSFSLVIIVLSRVPSLFIHLRIPLNLEEAHSYLIVVLLMSTHTASTLLTLTSRTVKLLGTTQQLVLLILSICPLHPRGSMGNKELMSPRGHLAIEQLRLIYWLFRWEAKEDKVPIM